jgi:hypothetical protein
MVRQAATSPGQVRTQLRAMLKSDVAIDPGQQLKLTIAGTYVKGPGLPLPTLNAGMHLVHRGGDHASCLQLPIVPWTHGEHVVAVGASTAGGPFVLALSFSKASDMSWGCRAVKRLSSC